MNGKSSYLILVSVIVFAATANIWMINAAQIEDITDPINHPLPSLPEPVLSGDAMKVEVKAGEDANGWSARIFHDYGSYTIDLINSTYRDGMWIVYYGIPDGIEAELYSLNLAWEEGTGTHNVTQSRCVWVMEEWPEELTISHSSDIHLPYGADVWARYGYEMNLIEPDAVIVTGDIVDVETIASAWRYYHDTLGKISSPTFILPGNHDYTSQAEFYRKYGGRLNYTVVIGDFVFVAMNSHSGGYIDMDELEWADAQLKKHPDKVKIIGFHHSIFSSEYEDDKGAVKGGRISGSWKDMTAFEDVIYDITWANKPEEAKRLVRLVEENDVRLILAGHVHRDIIYILNDKHYFVTTCPIGGGLPSGFHHGYRLINIDRDGNVEFSKITQDRIFDPPNSIPNGMIEYYYKTPNDGSRGAVSAIIENNLDMTLDDVEIEFVVSGTSEIEDYKWYPQEPENMEVYSSDGVHSFTGYFDVPSKSEISITLSAVQDSTNPSLELHVPSDYDPGEPINAILEVEDSGWGVRDVKAGYSTDGSTWSELDIPQEVNVDKDDYQLVYTSGYYELALPEGIESNEVTLKAEAWDFSDNHVSIEKTVSNVPPVSNYTLSIDTQPAGVEISINSETANTPYSSVLEEGNYTISVPESTTLEGKEYEFSSWSDEETGRERVAQLDEDTSLTANYELVEEEPSGGIPIPIEYVLVGLVLSIAVLSLFNRRG